MGLRKKLKVLQFMGGEHLPECAGLYLVIDSQYQYRTCTAEHREDGSFDLFRCAASDREIPGSQVLAYAPIVAAADVVQEVYCSQPTFDTANAMLARGFISVGQIAPAVCEPIRTQPARVLSLVPRPAQTGEPHVS